MDSNGVTYIISIFAIVCATSFLALNSVVPSPKTSRLSATYGLRLEYHLRKKNENGVDEEDEPPTTDIVFVHGLGADPSLTWRHGDICWITDLLPQDLREGQLQSSVRIFTFNYNSYWVRNADSTRLSETAKDLAKELRDKLKTQLILVGHSYGGLVIKRALVDISELSSRVEGVIFLGTPHSGTVFAQYGIFAATLFTPFDSDTNIIRLLTANNLDLKDLDDRFRAHYKDTKRFYYYERCKTRRYLFGIVPWIRDYVVSESSATVGGDFNVNIALHTDHRGLNKFRNRNEKNYLLVVEALLGILSSKDQARKVEHTPSHASTRTVHVGELVSSMLSGMSNMETTYGSLAGKGNEELDVMELGSSILTGLRKVRITYRLLAGEGNEELGRTFHAASGGLLFIEEVLEPALNYLAPIDAQSVAALESFKAILIKLQALFDKLLNIPQRERRDLYVYYIEQKGISNLVEILVVKMMNYACQIAKDYATEPDVAEPLAKLQYAIKELEDMQSSVPVRQMGGNQFMHCGGRQYNTKNGRHFYDTVFNGGAAFN